MRYPVKFCPKPWRGKDACRKSTLRNVGEKDYPSSLFSFLPSFLSTDHTFGASPARTFLEFSQLRVQERNSRESVFVKLVLTVPSLLMWGRSEQKCRYLISEGRDRNYVTVLLNMKSLSHHCFTGDRSVRRAKNAVLAIGCVQ